MQIYIPIILGTARQGRRSENAARFLLSEAEKLGIETELIDVRDFRIAATGEEHPMAKSLGEKIERAAGYIIVTPEYNHSYPGELKMFLDMFYKEYARKPIGFCGVSAGPMGGGRAIEQLRQVSIEFHMVPIREAIYFPNVKTLFNEQGKLESPASYKENLNTFFEELLWYAKALKEAREG